MTRDLLAAFIRLRTCLYNPSKRDKPGTCRVLQSDLEALLEEVQALSNMQKAKRIIKLTLEELRNGDSEAEGQPARAVEGRRRRNHPVHRAARAAAAGGAAEVAGPFVFGP